MEPNVMVYLMTGFLDSGKTQFLKFTLQQDYFQIDGKTLLILCEEGEEEYNPMEMLRYGVVIEKIEDQEDLTEEYLEELWKEFPGFSQFEVRSALAKCGLTTRHIESRVKVLSGGEQAKLRLCKLINRASNLLVLDEPTNHLDVDAKEELKRALLAYKGSILMVCHEPEFYEGLATRVWDCSQWTTRS